MQILIACAKLMDTTGVPALKFATKPTFEREALHNAAQLSQYSVDELQQMLKVNRAIAVENHLRYQNFIVESARRPAGQIYDGMVFKKLDLASFTEGELLYANDHLNICSFLYGLLRPLDNINPYRLEGNVELPENGGITMTDYWQPILTDYLIAKVKADDGILVNLASEEMKSLFDWKKVSSELTVVSPEFKVDKNGKLRTIVIYAKMCRGAMSRYILKNRITDIDSLSSFTYDGFRLIESKPRLLYAL